MSFKSQLPHGPLMIAGLALYFDTIGFRRGLLRVVVSIKAHLPMRVGHLQINIIHRPNRGKVVDVSRAGWVQKTGIQHSL